MESTKYTKRLKVLDIFKKELSKINDDTLIDDMKISEIAKKLEYGVYRGSTYAFKELYNLPRETVVKEKYYWAEDTFLKYYSKYFRKVYLNYFKNKRSHLLRMKTVTKKISLEDLGILTHRELDPELYEIRINNAKISYERDREPERPSETKQKMIEETKGMFKCGRCRSERTTYQTAQTRSADESETVFITCLDCKNRWKR